MKNLVFAAMALVLFAFNGNAQDFDDYGTSHNKMLEFYVVRLDKSANKKNVYEQLRNITEKSISHEDANKMYHFENFENPSQMNLELFQKKVISKELFDLINLDLQNSIKLKTITEINTFVEMNRIKNVKLSTDEKEKYLNFLSTLKHSFIFWDNAFSKNELLLGDSTNIISRERLPEGWRWKYIACDAVGAIFGGPAGAAAASLCYAISIL